MRRSLIAAALALAVFLPFAAVSPVHADDDTVLSASVVGDLPDEGVFLGIWDGGSVEELSVVQPQIGSIWVSVNGSLHGYLTGAPVFVNTPFLQTFPLGELAAGTPLLAVVVDTSGAPPPAATGTYSQETWTAFVDTLLRPDFLVESCPNCWPGYTGSSIGVTTRWLETAVLKVYVYSSQPDDIAALEQQLNQFQQLVGIGWSYAATPADANVHVFMSFDRANVPASFPTWAREGLEAQHLVDGWSAYTVTSYSYSVGPSGVDPAERFAIADASIFVPFNQKSGQLIPRALLDTNIRHELVHAIGWSDHWNVAERLMSPSTSTERALSELEWDMLSLLYEDTVEPGMYEEQLLASIAALP